MTPAPGLPCRVCGRPVRPWRRGWRRPTTRIHAACRRAVCRFCGAVYLVGRGKRGRFCCNEHQWSFLHYGRPARELPRCGSL